MENALWLGILLAILSSNNMNVGKAVQKWKVSVLAHRGQLWSQEHRKDFTIWLIGVLITASASITYSLALKFTDKASLVSSLNGVGMIGLVLFAWLVLKEKIGKQELGGAALVLAGTTLMGYFDKIPEQGQSFSLSRFIIAFSVMIAIFLPPALVSWRTRKLHGLTFGALAGIFLGSALILGDMALVRAGNSFLGQLKFGYPYVAMLTAIAALTVTQFAFWRSTAMVVVPTINSFMILCPVVLDYFTFGIVLQPLQYAAVLVIVGGVILLTYTETQDKVQSASLAEVVAGDE